MRSAKIATNRFSDELRGRNFVCGFNAKRRRGGWKNTKQFPWKKRVEVMETGKSFHLHVSIQGILSLTKEEFEQEYKGVFINADGSGCTYEEVRSCFEDHWKLGHRVYPMSDCDNFDWEKGCLGHWHDEKTEVDYLKPFSEFLEGK
jgi:hypothetical protein